MIRGNRKPSGGYIKKDGDQWVIVPAKEVLRVHRDLLNKELNLNVPHKPNPNYHPDWKGQQKPCWFKRGGQRNWKVTKISLAQQTGWEKGTLVLTGSAPKKKYDFVFVGRTAEG